MKKQRHIIMLAILSYACFACLASSSELIDPTLNARQNQFLNTQAEALLGHADEVLAKHPPAWPMPEARLTALFLLDSVLHDVYAPNRPPVQNFMKRRIKKAIEEIEKAQVTQGARIWKLYNHGFVIRTASVTLGFDLVRAESVRIEGFKIPKAHMARLISQCDVLFISHPHGDHVEEWVIQSFIDQGKPVVAPARVLKGRPIHKHIIHLNRVGSTQQPITVQGGKQTLTAFVYPGHQGGLDNNIPIVFTPEGLSFSQLGDQHNNEDLNWVDTMAERHRLDVLLPNCWTLDIGRVARGFAPKLIITGHENEMGHTIDHREPYWLTFHRRKGSRLAVTGDAGYDHPLVMMTWGESYHYQRSNFTN